VGTRLIIGIFVIASCSTSTPVHPGVTARNAPLPVVYWSEPPWAYRLGNEVFASANANADTSRIANELATNASALGCHAVVSVVVPPKNAGSDPRPWGFCAFRVGSDALPRSRGSLPGF
jgi:hypothetical protein